MRYFEDVVVGSTDSFGSYTVTKDEIMEFAEKYDPQPFHLDEAAAADSMFGELVASGWHTMAMCMRMIADRPDPLAALAGVGADNIRWRNPVTPGDTLSLRTEVLSKRASEGRDDWGFVTSAIECLNGDDEVVVSFETTALVQRREDNQYQQ
ncbi:MaoC family dehydratase [Halobellus ordinarius]|uniref:MaoC family dehydratase n=1 Tax=Halobellus ordinarius TaxID=3075120 RepID=UPI0028809DE8|nr:MaoC family dehydratase [Halobellus sp. ZY16]